MHNALPLVFSDLPTTHPPDTYLIGSSIFTAEKVIIGSDPTARSQQRLAVRHSLRSMLVHAKTNKDAAMEIHATSMKRARPASSAGMAPTTAINRATPATTNAVQRASVNLCSTSFGTCFPAWLRRQTSGQVWLPFMTRSQMTKALRPSCAGCSPAKQTGSAFSLECKQHGHHPTKVRAGLRS
jgi:hypothetical protein